VADGVIVATPTGSTAYSMAAGGPIMHPELRSIIVTPIAPYLTIVKSLVLPDDNVLDLHIDTDDEAFLTVDGQTHVPLLDGDTVRVTISSDPCLFARVQDKAYFSATLVNRLRRAE
jgi:NAD+ kinase